MDDGHDQATDIPTRHRNEKKQLQNEIMTLKKSVGKNDKKAKKEVTAKVAVLEAELEARHERELSETTASDPSRTAGGEASTTEPTGKREEEGGEEGGRRVSKAQRRREKKEAADRAREAAIKAGEAEARDGPRQRESLAVALALQRLGLGLVEVPADGDCLFSALAHQLALHEEDASADELRGKAADAMGAREEDFRPFLLDEASGDALDEQGFRDYLQRLRRPAFWGGEPEIRALSTVLRRPIRVVQAEGDPLLLGSELPKPQLTITFHQHVFSLGSHYNSTKPLPS